ncbi:protein ACCELERATED CELL DEATH 6-like isoform X2 [Pistacia vera]|uniref:protein ACCELERATED CELL DEATH 6-like isoform X2 n=1 Tax=Pistacia vera TaxID=55513 RepID=UPI001263A6F9|nr:protein ACCELERATED CELL DEATH 6-like isoform X2 [Pistacia vera]
MDSAQPFTNLVERKGDEITEVNENASGEQPAKSQSHKNDEAVNAEANSRSIKGNPFQPTIDQFFSKTGQGVIEVKQGDFKEQTATTQSYKNDGRVNVEVEKRSEGNEDHIKYQSLYKAVQENDWKRVDDFITKDPVVLTAKIKVFLEETVIHVITLNLDSPFWLLEKVASMVGPDSLERLTDEYGQTPIFHAAKCGNTKAAKAFVHKNKELPNIRNNDGLLPIRQAAIRGHKETIQYLLSVTAVSLDNSDGVFLLKDLTNSGLYGVSLDLLKRYPNLARVENQDRGSILLILANKPLAFQSGIRLGFWKRLIYKWIPVQEEHIPGPESVDRDVKTPDERSKTKLAELTDIGFLQQMMSTATSLVPITKSIHDAKLTNMQAHEIVKIMCHDRVIWSNREAFESLCTPVLTAAASGIYELVNEIMKAYFFSFTFSTNGNDIFRVAILNRHEKVFSLVNRKNILLTWDPDMKQVADMSVKKDNILHFAGRFVPLDHIPGPALQMQGELQWFKAVESFVHPSLHEQKNWSNKTPRQVFTESHKNLVKEGEKWMKETASSCTVIAALIITVVFAAAFTVPGGNDSTKGTPIFLHKPSFIVFVISDSFALFTSTASLLMFMAILTSRYAEADFLESLPKKLIIGLITLFFSIASMMVAFGATLYIFLSHPWKWTIIPISLLGCLPVSLFALLQFPLLVEMISSTYGSSILQPTK